MTTSQFIAGLLGPPLIAVAAFMLLRRNAFAEFVEQAANNRPVIFIAGVILMVAGLAMLQVHNLWVSDWRVLITIFAWLMLIGGAIRILFADMFAPLVEKFGTDHPMVLVQAVIVLALGAFFTAKAHSLL